MERVTKPKTIADLLRRLCDGPFCLVHLSKANMTGGENTLLRLVPESSIKRDVYGQIRYARENDRERYAAAPRKAGLPEE
jgi:hypothetical protein